MAAYFSDTTTAKSAIEEIEGMDVGNCILESASYFIILISIQGHIYSKTTNQQKEKSEWRISSEILTRNGRKLAIYFRNKLTSIYTSLLYQMDTYGLFNEKVGCLKFAVYEKKSNTGKSRCCSLKDECSEWHSWPKSRRQSKSFPTSMGHVSATNNRNELIPCFSSVESDSDGQRNLWGVSGRLAKSLIRPTSDNWKEEYASRFLAETSCN